MNKRQNKLVDILTEMHCWMNNTELSALLGVSDRTIRSDINAINKSCEVPLIESSIQNGYRIENRFGMAVVKKEDHDIPQDPHTRFMYIIQKLLFGASELSLTELQAEIYISGYSIENDIKRIRKMLEPYNNLKLIRRKEYLSLFGDELSKRKFYKDLLVAEVGENFYNLNHLATLYAEFDLIEVKNILMETVEEYNYALNEVMLPMLILHLGTSIERMMHYNYMQVEDDENSLEETIEYQISKAFYGKIEKKLQIVVKESEVRQFALVILRRQTFAYTRDYICLEGNWVNTKMLVEEVLENIYEMFGVDFKSDKDLIAGLKMHIYGMIERYKNQVLLEDVLVEDIKRQYPLVFEMGINASRYIGNKFGIEIAHSETGFVALHLGSASERMNATKRYRAVILVPYKQSFYKMSVSKISNMFSDRMEIVQTYQMFDEKEIRKMEPDLILSACPLKHELDILTVPINLFINTETEVNILQALNRLDKNRFKLEFLSKISGLIRKPFYTSELDLNTPEEVIGHLCDKLEEGGISGSHYKDVVLKREELSSTSFANALAIPHAFGTFSNKSTIAVAQLKKPMQWGSFEVRIVMLFAIDEENQRMIKMFFDWVSAIINDNKQMAVLCQPCAYEEFIEKIIG